MAMSATLHNNGAPLKTTISDCRPDFSINLTMKRQRGRHPGSDEMILMGVTNADCDELIATLRKIKRLRKTDKPESDPFEYEDRKYGKPNEREDLLRG